MRAEMVSLWMELLLKDIIQVFGSHKGQEGMNEGQEIWIWLSVHPLIPPLLRTQSYTQGDFKSLTSRLSQPVRWYAEPVEVLSKCPVQGKRSRLSALGSHYTTFTAIR